MQDALNEKIFKLVSAAWCVSVFGVVIRWERLFQESEALDACQFGVAHLKKHGKLDHPAQIGKGVQTDGGHGKAADEFFTLLHQAQYVAVEVFLIGEVLIEGAFGDFSPGNDGGDGSALVGFGGKFIDCCLRRGYVLRLED